jgi:mannose-6-phosphate isomerase
VYLEKLLKFEERPWGNFKVFLVNSEFRRDWAEDFFRELAEKYPLTVRSGRLSDFMEGMLEDSVLTSTTVKIIKVNPMSRLSLQYHDHRSEDWFCLSGTAYAQRGVEGRVLRPGSSFHVPKGMVHRLESREGAEVLEIASGRFDESDIVRLQDDYSRQSKTTPEP